MNLPAVGDTPLNGLCQLAHFEQLKPWLNEMVPFGREAFGPNFPSKTEYRKHWEVVQAGRALAATDCLRPDSEILGVGAGNEPTIFWLTNHVRRVFATDLYLSEGWEESANSSMLLEPQSDWFGDWNPNRLVAQHMDALDLRYEDNSFDGAFSSSSIEHFGTWGDVATAMAEVHRVLKPGGTFSVSTEYRLSGPPPGMPNVLMFDDEALRRYVIESADWQVVGPSDWTDPSHAVADISFGKAVGELRQHTALYGEIVWSRLQWPEYPHIVLEHEGRRWVSLHLTLQKRGVT